MSAFKDMYIQTHEELIAEYMDKYPMTSWSAAYELTANDVDKRMGDKWAALMDQQRMEDE